MDIHTFNPDNVTNGQMDSLDCSNEVVQPQNPYKTQDGNSWIYPKPPSEKPVKKQPFLKRGTGIARYYKDKVPEPVFSGLKSKGTRPLTAPPSTSGSNLRPDSDARTNGLSARISINDANGAKQKEPLNSIGENNNDYKEQLNHDVSDFTGGLGHANGGHSGNNPNDDDSPLPSRYSRQQDDPYMEMDSSFTESESQLIDLFAEAKDTENKNRPMAGITKPPSPLLRLLSKSMESVNDGDSMADEIQNMGFEDDEELRLFELMEKISEQPDLSTNSAVVNEFVNTRLDLSPTPQTSNHSNGSLPRALSATRKNSFSLCSVASSTSTTSEKKSKSADLIPPNVLERVLEQVRNDSEKFSRIIRESGGQKTSTDLQGALLTARTMELEAEIKKFREENKNVSALREEWQARCNELQNCQTQHEQLKDRELRLIEEEKARLARKKERLGKILAECEAKSAKLDTSETDSGRQIQLLNEKIIKLYKDIRSRNSQFIKAQNKLKDELAALQEENAKLSVEIERLHKRYSDHLANKSAQMSSRNITPEASKPATAIDPAYSMPRSPGLSSLLPTNPRPASANRAEDGLNQHTARKSQSNGDHGVERILSNGDQEIKYANGTTKIISKDSLYTRVNYYNGDIRETMADGTIRYFYNESSSWHTTYPDGLEVVEFPGGQVERKNPNGLVEIIYSNGCIKHIYPCGKEECIFPDQTILRTERNGDKVLLLANGQKEYQTKDFRKRLYPDGTVKILYSDGSQETRYPDGRVRMKNSEGKLIHDAIHPKEDQQDS